MDLNNLVVNQYNLGYQPVQYLEKIKNCEVRQIHLAGHTVKEKVRIDTHDCDISQEALDLLPIAQKYWPDANPMIEWDDKIPPIEYLLKQREKIQNLMELNVVASAASYESLQTNFPSTKHSKSTVSENEKHQFFWALLKSDDYVEKNVTEQLQKNDLESLNLLKDNCPTPANVGMNVYSSAYYNRLIEVLEKDFPVLKTILDEFYPAYPVIT